MPIDGQLALIRPLGQRLPALSDKFRQLDRLPFDFQLTSVCPGEVQQVLNHLLHLLVDCQAVGHDSLVGLGGTLS